jgi:hypothetical protein
MHANESPASGRHYRYVGVELRHHFHVRLWVFQRVGACHASMLGSTRSQFGVHDCCSGSGALTSCGCRGIPALAHLLSSSGAGNDMHALVLALTRELTLQTYNALSALDAVRCAAMFGGVDKAQQVRAIKGAQVVIGTPGHVLDLIGSGALTLGGVEYLVLDEADRMLDKGVKNDIRRIIGYAKQGAERQTLMCMSISAFSSLLCIDVKRANGSQRYLAQGGVSVGGLVLARSSTDYCRK